MRKREERQLVLTSLLDFGGGEIEGEPWPSSLRFFIAQILCDCVRLGNVVVAASEVAGEIIIQCWKGLVRRERLSFLFSSASVFLHSLSLLK